jgi:CBS domain-containing protein
MMIGETGGLFNGDQEGSSLKRLKIDEVQGGAGLADGQAGEAVVLTVRGGEIVAVIPAGVEDDAVVEQASSLRGALRLENERVLTFEIHAGAAQASFRDEPAHLHQATASPRAHAPAPAIAVVSRPPAALGRITVDQIMTRNVIVASADELVEDIAKKLAFHSISGMPVEDWDGKVIGIISEFDVIGKFHDTIRDAMSADVTSVPPGTPLEQVAALMTEKRIKRVPVLENGMLIGIVSRADIVRALAAQGEAS